MFKNLSHFRFIALSILLIFTIVGYLSYKKTFPFASCSKCNVIIIDIDILRADALPCYGYFRNTTPNICNLAQKSLLFANNYSQSFWTLPSVMSTITSLYPTTHQVFIETKDKLPPNTMTMAQYFKNIGYRTYLQEANTITTLGEENGGIKGFGNLEVNIDYHTWASRLKDIAVEEKPFFMYFNTQSLHLPYIVDDESKLLINMKKPNGFPMTEEQITGLVNNYLVLNYKKIFHPLAFTEYPYIFNNIEHHKIELGEFFKSLFIRNDRSKYISDGFKNVYEPYISRILSLGTEGTQFMRLLYDSNLFEIDSQVGEIVNYVQSSPLSKNTIIIVMSEHGEEFGDHGGYAHMGKLYNELIHTPLIISLPGIKKQTITSVSQNIDILPTLADIIGFNIKQKIDGVSQVRNIYSMTSNLPDNFAVSVGSPNHVSIENTNWKLIIDNYIVGLPKYELYNLVSDPQEQNNVYYKNQQISSELNNLLNQKINKAKIKLPSTLPSGIDKEKYERMKREGYF